MIICSQLDFNEIDQFCQNIIDTFQENLVINQYEICVTASMGVSFSTADSTDIETLINNSYLALRKAKTNGKQSYQFYRKDMATESHNNLKADLKEAIEKDQFSVHYQPVINPQTGRIISLEALLRWQHPELGIIKPATFIPLAEQTGLIFSLGEFILNTVCLQHRDWQKIGIPKIPVSINFSPQQLKQLNLREKISQIFEDTGFDSHNLIIEIEESTITDDLGYAPSIFWELCELGIKFSVDNFGNRDSSFSHIQNFPFYYLKTDPSLIQTIANEQSTLRVLEALLTFSKNLKLQLVVKGVENKEQLGLLRELQCQAVQGNFIYSAMPAFQMTQVLQKHFQYSM
jgi:EAL domain-containing protein (putative c-di-GMP-specific phosphodiesterase class I)